MPKSAHQKLKLYRLCQILLRNTDESHGITMAEIRDRLLEYDIKADRKSLYDDIRLTSDLGVWVDKYQEGRSTYYYVSEKQFELPELKLLVDLVQSSKFITKKKSDALIRKITTFASRYEEMQLKRQVLVYDRIKTMNESIYYNVDEIHGAIARDRKISFEYLVWNLKKELVKKHDRPVCVSPWALLWRDENYYLIAYDSDAEMIKHYRVDKMRHIQMIDENRDGRERFEQRDLGEYANKRFGMFGGSEMNVRIRFENGVVGVILDRFGTDIAIHPVDEKHSDTIVSVAVSDQFFGWVFGLGNRVKIMAPDRVEEQYRRKLKNIAGLYEGD